LGLGDKRVSAQIELITPRWVAPLVGGAIFPPTGDTKMCGEPNVMVTLIKRRKSWDF